MFALSLCLLCLLLVASLVPSFVILRAIFWTEWALNKKQIIYIYIYIYIFIFVKPVRLFVALCLMQLGCSSCDLPWGAIESTQVSWRDGSQNVSNMYEMKVAPGQSINMIQLPAGVHLQRSYTTGHKSTYTADGNEHVFLINESFVAHLVFVSIECSSCSPPCLCSSLLRA